jgi:hypothetical protein
MSSSKAEVKYQDLDVVEREIADVKGKIGELEQKLEAFENDKSPKDKTSLDGNLEDQRRLTEWVKRLNGLENRRILISQAVATTTAQQGK